MIYLLSNKKNSCVTVTFRLLQYKCLNCVAVWHDGSNFLDSAGNVMDHLLNKKICVDRETFRVARINNVILNCATHDTTMIRLRRIYHRIVIFLAKTIYDR